MVIQSGTSALDSEHEKALQERVLIAAGVVTGAGVMASTGALKVALTKSGPLKVVLAVAISGTVGTAAWLQHRSSDETKPVASIVLAPEQSTNTVIPTLSELILSEPILPEPILPEPILSEPILSEENTSEVRRKRKTAAKTRPSVAPEPAVAPESDSTLAKEVGYVRRIRAELSGGSPRAALSQAQRHLERFPEGVLAQDVGFLRLRALHKIDKERFSSACLLYLKDYPATPYRSKIDALLE